MPRLLRRLACLALLAGVFAAAGSAEIIVNTGPGSFSNNGYSYMGWSLLTYQYLAGQFSTTQAHTITDVQGWMDNAGSYWDGARQVIWSGSAGDVTIALYSEDGGGVPGATRQELGTIHLNAGSYPDWYGLTGLALYLPVGTYWVAFEPSNGFEGTMPSWSWTFPQGPLPKNPENAGEGYLTGWAYQYESAWGAFSQGWPMGTYGIGVKIQGTPAETGVPEPAALWLAALGLIAAALRRLARS